MSPLHSSSASVPRWYTVDRSPILTFNRVTPECSLFPQVDHAKHTLDKTTWSHELTGRQADRRSLLHALGRKINVAGAHDARAQQMTEGNPPTRFYA